MSVILPAAEVPGAAQESTSTAILAAVAALEADLATVASVDFATSAKQDSSEAILTTIDASASGISTELVTLNATATGVESELTTLNATTSARMAGSFVPAAYDFMSYTSGATDDVYVFKTGGATGTTVKTLTIVYTGADKGTISTVTAV